MSEVAKAVGQWIVANVPWAILIFLFILSCLFRITKRDIDPLGWVIGWIGKAFTKDAREDIRKLSEDTATKFEEVKKDREAAITKLKEDYNDKIADLRADLDGFEASTNASIQGMQEGTSMNCELLKSRLDAMEKSNDMQTIRQIKAHVLDFANSCMNGRKHTYLEFRALIKEDETYNKLVEKYGLKNAVYKDDFNYVMEVYHECKKNRTFLNDDGRPLKEEDENEE